MRAPISLAKRSNSASAPAEIHGVELDCAFTLDAEDRPDRVVARDNADSGFAKLAQINLLPSALYRDGA